MNQILSLPPDEIRHLVVNNGIGLIAAVLTLIIGWTVARLAGRWLRFALDRIPQFDRTLTPLLTKMVRYGIMAITVILMLQRFGVETTSLIAVLGAAGLAIGLALQGTLSNVAAGVMLLVLRPFKVGDYIEVNSTAGTVREVGLFTTVLVTADLLYVSMPNSAIFSNTITNFTREPNRRINLTIRIGYDDNIEHVQKIALDIIAADPRILKTPQPIVPVAALEQSSVNLYVRCWVPTADYWTVLFDLQKSIKQRFDAEGVSIPYPHQVNVTRDQPADAKT